MVEEDNDNDIGSVTHCHCVEVFGSRTITDDYLRRAVDLLAILSIQWKREEEILFWKSKRKLFGRGSWEYFFGRGTSWELFLEVEEVTGKPKDEPARFSQLRSQR